MAKSKVKKGDQTTYSITVSTMLSEADTMPFDREVERLRKASGGKTEVTFLQSQSYSKDDNVCSITLTAIVVRV